VRNKLNIYIPEIDLEDDFEAFQAAAEHEAQLEVEVGVDSGNSSPVESSRDPRTAEVCRPADFEYL
jgi:hypothetical protein